MANKNSINISICGLNTQPNLAKSSKNSSGNSSRIKECLGFRNKSRKWKKNKIKNLILNSNKNSKMPFKLRTFNWIKETKSRTIKTKRIRSKKCRFTTEDNPWRSKRHTHQLIIVIHVCRHIPKPTTEYHSLKLIKLICGKSQNFWVANCRTQIPSISFPIQTIPHKQPTLRHWKHPQIYK